MKYFVWRQWKEDIVFQGLQMALTMLGGPKKIYHYTGIFEESSRSPCWMLDRGDGGDLHEKGTTREEQNLIVCWGKMVHEIY